MTTQDPKGLVKASYDTIAPAYLNFITKLPSPKLLWVDKLLKNLTSTSKVLELGCGNGLSGTLPLAEKVGHVIANDISTAQIDIAKEKLAGRENVEFVAGDMTTLKFGDGAFDGVMALHSIFHLPREEQPAMLRLVYRWLKDGGHLLINFDEQEHPGAIMKDWLGADMFSDSLGAEGSKQMLLEAGFEVVEAEVVRTVDEKKTVPMLWVLARKP